MRPSSLVSALLALGVLGPAPADGGIDSATPASASAALLAANQAPTPTGAGPTSAAEPASAPAPAAAPPAGPWLGEQLPLPLQVKTPQDLALKAVAERQYLIFNLLARGKLAWDSGDYSTAASKWEELLRIPGLDAELERVIRPLARDARSRASGAAATAPAAGATEPALRRPPNGAVVPMVSVSGEVRGGGSRGPAGAVIWLRRTDGSTPRPAPLRGRTMVQASKAFVPRVLPVTVGSTVTFTNKDNLVHNVFSLSPAHAFDGGLSQAGKSFTRTFSKPGVVEILCNIHASERAHVVVIDSPWYAEADSRGAFVVRGLPPGDYDLDAWHEAASQTTRMRVRVGVDGLRGVAVNVSSDRGSSAPDKARPPRP